MNNERINICKYIQTNIDKLCQTEIDEIFKIIHSGNGDYTQNNNGIFINLNWIDDEILDKIHNYILFCLRSQNEIKKYEEMKSVIEDTIINKEKTDKDNVIIDTKSQTSNVTNITKLPKISSSMKFYLLKKKFQKKNNTYVYINNTLTPEKYIYN